MKSSLNLTFPPSVTGRDLLSNSTKKESYREIDAQLQSNEKCWVNVGERGRKDHSTWSNKRAGVLEGATNS